MRSAVSHIQQTVLIHVILAVVLVVGMALTFWFVLEPPITEMSTNVVTTGISSSSDSRQAFLETQQALQADSTFSGLKKFAPWPIMLGTVPQGSQAPFIMPPAPVTIPPR